MNIPATTLGTTAGDLVFPILNAGYALLGDFWAWTSLVGYASATDRSAGIETCDLIYGAGLP